MKLVLTGIQGSGKSTQGNLLSKQLKIPYLSTGHIFRQIAKEKTKLGHYVKVVMNSGLLIPDDKTIEIVNSYISRPEYKSGYIIDGFPRTLNQAEEFKNDVDKVVYLEIPDKEALWRISFRNSDGREDENLEALRKRIELFHKHTEPVLRYYEKQGKLLTVDGTQTVKEVNSEILKSLGKQLVRNRVKEWDKKNKAIIAITGLPGSGKTEASAFFKEKGIPIISFGKIVNDYVDKNNLSHVEGVHQKVRMDFRKEHGFEAMAKLSEETIEKMLEKNKVIVIDHLQSWEEYQYLKKRFPNLKVYLLALYADKTLRYRRIKRRQYRGTLSGEERDINELMEAHKAPVIGFADFLVKNNFSIDEFYDKLDDVYRAVYYS